MSNFMPYLAIRNRQLQISAFKEADVDSVYKHLRKKQNSHHDTELIKCSNTETNPKGLSFVTDVPHTVSMYKLEQPVRGEH